MSQLPTSHVQLLSEKLHFLLMLLGGNLEIFSQGKLFPQLANLDPVPRCYLIH